MFNIKNASVAAAAGFVLSFLISIIATHKFGVSFFRGAIFALIFAALCLAADFVSRHFLDTGASKIPVEPSRPRTSGTRIDIMVDDESLTDDGKAPAFNVNIARGNPYVRRENSAEAASAQEGISDLPDAPAMAESAPVEAAAAPAREPSAPVSAPAVTDAPAEEFTPVPLGTPAPASSRKGSEREQQKQEIDALPDIGDSSAEDDSFGSGGDVVSNSEFAEDGDGEDDRVSLANGEDAVKQDTKIIASAIRTMLKKD